MRVFGLGLCVGLALLFLTPATADPMGTKVGTRYLDAGLLRDLRHFFGDRRGDLILPGKLLSEQAAEGLTAAPADVVRLPSGDEFLGSCRRHSCDEKTGVLFSESGRIIGVGIVNYHCRHDSSVIIINGRKRRGVTCDDVPRLTIFIRSKDKNNDTSHILQWARSFQDDRDIKYEIVELPSAQDQAAQIR